MKKIICSLVLACTSASLFAQVLSPEDLNKRPDIRRKIYKDSFIDYGEKDHPDSVFFFQQREYIAYPPIREADVLWSKQIYRDIEVGEKINLPLYYPVPGNGPVIEDRQNLFDILQQAYRDKLIQGFEGVDAAFDAEFRNALTVDQCDGAFGYKKTEKLTLPDGTEVDTTYISVYAAEDVISYRLKEYWYFDKQRSQLMCKIYGILPICKREMPNGDIIKQSTAWFYFPEVRAVLANKEVYNRKNETIKLTFDDVFIKRYFSSHIIKEDNVFNRTLEGAGYKGFENLVEADRIKEKIFNFEQIGRAHV